MVFPKIRTWVFFWPIAYFSILYYTQPIYVPLLRNEIDTSQRTIIPIVSLIYLRNLIRAKPVSNCYIQKKQNVRVCVCACVRLILVLVGGRRVFD